MSKMLTKTSRILWAVLLISLLGLPIFAADLPPGVFMWQDTTDHGFDDNTRSVAISGTMAFAASLYGAPGGGLDFSIKAFEASTGRVLWEDHVPAATSINADVFITASGDKLFALGYVPGDNVSSSDIFMRGYDLVSGHVLWSNYWTAGRDNLPKGGIAVNNGRVTFVGYGNNANPGEFVHGLVRTLNATTGSVMWESVINKGVADDAVWDVSSDGNRVLTAGTTTTANNTQDLVLRSYNAATGALQWEKMRASTIVCGIRVSGTRVFVAGTDLSNYSNIRTFLAAYNLSNGQLLWQATPSSGSFSGLAANTTQVVAVGNNSNRGLLLGAFDPTNGSVLWADTTSPAGSNSESLRKVTLTDRAVYAVGNDGQDAAYSEMLLKVYSSTGDPLYEERSNRTKSTGSFGINVDLNYVLTSGFAKPGTTMDGVVRAYNVSIVEHPPTFRITTVLGCTPLLKKLKKCSVLAPPPLFLR